MSDFENLSKSVSALQANVAGLTEELSNVTNSVNQMVHDNSKLLLEENSKLKADIAQMKSVINRQAAYIADLDANLDDMGQYGRRENVVFTNLLVNPDEQNVQAQIIELCNQIEVEVAPTDIVACHALPAQVGKPKRYIARFHERSKTQLIFRNRKKAKNISTDAKGKLAADNGKGFGIMPNLTVKRGKLFAQVKKFNEQFEHDGCWVDPNSGKILMKVRGENRGRVIKNTSDLLEINNTFIPSDWYFCSVPTFTNNHDISPPADRFGNGNLSLDVFSPSTPKFGGLAPKGNLREFGYDFESNRFNRARGNQGAFYAPRGNQRSRGQLTRGGYNRDRQY